MSHSACAEELGNIYIYIYIYICAHATAKTTALLPTKPSLDDDCEVRHGFREEVSLSPQQYLLAGCYKYRTKHSVIHNINRI